MSPIDRLSLYELRTAARRLAEITQSAEALFEICTTRRIVFCRDSGRDYDLDKGRMDALIFLSLIDPARFLEFDKRAAKALSAYLRARDRRRKRTAESQAAATTTPQDPQS